MYVRAFALLLALPAFGVHAQYKWTDSSGQVSYGDQAPRDALHVERLGDLAPAPDNSDALARLPYEVRTAAKNFPVTFYARPSCAPCDLARNFLKGRGIPFAERTVVSQEDVIAFQLLGGGDQLPTLAVGRQLLRGFETNAWSEALTSAAYPASSMLPQSWQWPAATPLAAPTTAADSADAGTSR